jgi:histidinol dehydrogenase
MLATARELGLDEVYRVGGAQAVAAMAFGTHSIPRVDKIVGPGNIYVALAKKEVFSAVDIDMIAGPSEILIIADETASPALCAADMLGQAEHDPGAAVLLTPSGDLANDTAAELERQLAGLGRAEAARRSLERYGLIGVVRDLAECVELANMVAPEHVEVMTREPHDVLPHLRHCGAVFLGDSTPEAVGDYVAGPSHVLPTGGTARFFSGLSFLDFLKRTSVIEYSRRALAAEAEDIVALADAEGLGAHARSAWLRLEGEAKA